MAGRQASKRGRFDSIKSKTFSAISAFFAWMAFFASTRACRRGVTGVTGVTSTRACSRGGRSDRCTQHTSKKRPSTARTWSYCYTGDSNLIRDCYTAALTKTNVTRLFTKAVTRESNLLLGLLSGLLCLVLLRPLRQQFRVALPRAHSAREARQKGLPSVARQDVTVRCNGFGRGTRRVRRICRV